MDKRHRGNRRGGRRVGNAGFSLVELMVTVAVLAVLLGLAVPSFQGVIQQNRLTAATNELVAAVQLARAEAIRRNREVELCPTENGSTCGGSSWSRVAVRVPSSSEVVREFGVTGGGITAVGSNRVGNRIAFRPNGLVRVGSGASIATSGTLSICSMKVAQGQNTRDIQVAVSRVRVARRDGGAACAQVKIND